jgi:hypothetical protein
MNLSPHFTLAELVCSATAEQRGIDNTPPGPIIEALRNTAEHMELVRLVLGGKPIKINSGYRSPALNTAVGSKPTSDHCKGWAVDFVCPAFGTPEDICHRLVASDIRFKQLLFEHTWVHISFDLVGELAGRPAKREVLTLVAGGYQVGIVPKTGQA